MAHWHRPRRTGRQPQLNRIDCGRIGCQRRARVPIETAGDRRRHFVIVGQQRLGRTLEQRGNLRMKAHGGAILLSDRAATQSAFRPR
jgi:hypothetical protein